MLDRLCWLDSIRLSAISVVDIRDSATGSLATPNLVAWLLKYIPLYFRNLTTLPTFATLPSWWLSYHSESR